VVDVSNLSEEPTAAAIKIEGGSRKLLRNIGSRVNGIASLKTVTILPIEIFILSIDSR
jgi:hypothetical protein